MVVRLQHHCCHCFVEVLIDGLSAVSIDPLCSNLKAVTRSFDIKHSKAAFKDNENLHQYHNLDFYPTKAIHQRIKVCNIVVIPSV